MYAIDLAFTFTAAAYNLARLAKIAGDAGMSTPSGPPTRRPLAGRQGRHLGSRSLRPLGERPSRSPTTVAARSLSALSRPASTSNAAGCRSASPGRASTKWTRSPATVPPNCSTTARSRSNSPITTVIKRSSKPNDRLLHQPDRDVEQQPHVPKINRTMELRAMF